MRKNLHHLIINMGVSDALFLVSALWNRISLKYHIESLYPAGVWGDIICKITGFIPEISYKVSLVTLLVISIERFRATRRTLQRSRQYTLRKRVAVLSIFWLIPMAIDARWLHVYYFERQNCFFLYLEYYMIIGAVAFLIITIVIITILALSIIAVRRLSRPQAIVAHMNVEQQRNRRRRTMAAVSMVLASVVLYSCCWFPYSFLVNLHYRCIFFKRQIII